MADLPYLDPTEQRILGALLEKQKTVPATYPLSLNALRTACNQTSSRDPVVDYDEATLSAAIPALKDRGLLRVVWAERGPRTLKYHQLLDRVLDLADDERAVLTVLLLRGPNAPGELRTRTERLHPFADRGAVEAVLHRLATREQPLVVELERRPGQQDRRWVHLLGDVPVAAAPAGADLAVDREVVLADGPEERDRRLRTSYDEVAVEYAERLADELTGKPFDTWLLWRIAALAGDDPVLDAGTGPGHVAAELAAAGATVTGVDLSPGMIEEARRRFPDLAFEVADLTRLLRPATAAGWGAITAWYSLIHLAGSELPSAMQAMVRVLRPGGWLALAVHAGAEVRHLDDWWEHPVDLDFVLHDPDEVLSAAYAAGLTDVEWYIRGPRPGAEAETNRFYLLGRTPTD